MIRLALVGCDDISRGYAQVSSRLQGAAFTAVADPDPAKAADAAKALGAAAQSSGLAALLADHADAFDAVLIHSSDPQHEKDAQRAAAAGKHVFVQSPLALFVQGADAVIAACRAAGVRLMIGQPARFLPIVQAVKQSLDAGQLGSPGLLRIHRWEPAEGTTKDKRGCLSYVLADIDLANWLFGRLPDVIYAVSRGEAARFVQLHLGFPDGGMALIDYAGTLPPGEDYFSLSLIGSRGAAYADDHHNMHLLYRGGPPAAVVSTPDTLHLVAELKEFVAAIVGSRAPAVSGADGRNAVLVAEAAAASADSGRALHLVGDRYEPSNPPQKS